MTASRTFGRRLAEAPTAVERLAIDAEEDRRGELRQVDEVIDSLIVRGMAGEKIIKLGDRHDDEAVQLPGVSDDQMQAIAVHVDVDAMEARGAWALPAKETIQAGWANLGYWTRQDPRFVGSLADDDRHRITLRGNPAGTFAWAAITPIFELLAVPHDLRAGKAGKADVKAQQKAWAPLDAMLAACSIDLSAELALFRPGSGWSRLTAQERARARLKLVEGWARHANPDVAARLRMWMLGSLVDRFYAKGKQASPTSRQALTKAYWRPMVGLFAGDWLALLAYLGEPANPGEEIVSALPQPKLFVGGTDGARQAGAEAGVEAGEVERMLASFFGGADGRSPVERRTAVLRRTWDALDGVYASQTPATGALWGVLDERDEAHDKGFDNEYRKGLYRTVLPAELNAEIERCWGTVATSKNPDRLVTRWLPHNGVWDTFGAGLHLWHDVALTAFNHTETVGFWEWGLSEISPLQTPRLEELKAAGCPVDPAFFKELATAARELPPIQHEQRTSSREIEGITISVTVTGGGREKRAGFEQLRDVITRHRRAWANEHLEAWLAYRWRTDLRAAAETFNRALISKGKPPTVRQSINASQPALDRWFAGGIRQLLNAIGQQAPTGQPIYERHFPADPYTFGQDVEQALGGGLPVPDMTTWSGDDRKTLATFTAARAHNDARYYAAFTAYEYARAWEALGEQPEMKQVKSGKSGAEHLTRQEPEMGWPDLEQAILKVLADPSAPTISAPALPYAGDGPVHSLPSSAPPPTASTSAPPGRHRGLRRLLGKD